MKLRVMLMGWLALLPVGVEAAEVERFPGELPAAIGTDTELVVLASKAGAVRWAVNGWTRPDRGVWPAGTREVAAGAVETPLRGPGRDGLYRATLGPFAQGVGQVDLVVRHQDGSWDNGGGRSYSVGVVAGTPSRRRPITIGRGPFVGRSGRVDHFEDFMDWEAADCRGVDPADDGVDLGDHKAGSRDLVALYTRREGGVLFARVDVLDLGLGDETGSLDVVLLVDCAWGGQTFLPNFVVGQTARPWDVAVVVKDGQGGQVWDAGWNDKTRHYRGAHVRSDLDAIEFGVSEDALREAGWDGRSPLSFQAFTVADGVNRIADAFGEADLSDQVLDRVVEESELGGTAKYSVILHGNQAVQPARWIHDLVESQSTLTPSGNPTGYLRALDAHEIFRAPVNIHISGSLAGTAEWSAPEFNERVRGFLDAHAENGEGDLIGGVLAEHIMPYFENGRSAAEGVNGSSVRLNEELLDRIYGGRSRSVFWIPERVVRGTTFSDVLWDGQGQPTGYRFSVVDQVNHVANWYGGHDAHGRNGYKINRINGVSCFVINDGADQWKFANTDGGLWVWTRRDLIAKALDWDQEQLTLVFDDWEAFSGRSFTSFGVGNDNPDNYEATVRWIANHPWIQVETLETIAQWGWQEVERGNDVQLPIDTYDWLSHATERSYDNWYYGSSQEESFWELHPPVTPGVFGSKRFGAVDRPGDLLHDVWADVARQPVGRLRDLAQAIYSVDVFETAWHDEDMNDYLSKTQSGDYRFPDTTYDRVSGWARAMHARVGDAGTVAVAARWSASAPSGTSTWREDVDHDGQAEFVVADARAIYVFEDDGGRLVLGAVRDPQTGRADVFAACLLHAPAGEEHRDREAEHEDGVTRVNGLVDWWATGGGSRYVNQSYMGSDLGDGWRFRSADGRVEKTVRLVDGDLEVSYAVDPAAGTLYVRNGLTPAILDVFMGGEVVAQHLGDRVTARAQSGVGGEVSVSVVAGAGAQIEHGAQFGGLGARGTAFTYQVELSGSGRFGFRLEPRLR